MHNACEDAAQALTAFLCSPAIRSTLLFTHAAYCLSCRRPAPACDTNFTACCTATWAARSRLNIADFQRILLQGFSVLLRRSQQLTWMTCPLKMTMSLQSLTGKGRPANRLHSIHATKVSASNACAQSMSKLHMVRQAHGSSVSLVCLCPNASSSECMLCGQPSTSNFSFCTYSWQGLDFLNCDIVTLHTLASLLTYTHTTPLCSSHLSVCIALPVYLSELTDLQL